MQKGWVKNTLRMATGTISKTNGARRVAETGLIWGERKAEDRLAQAEQQILLSAEERKDEDRLAQTRTEIPIISKATA